MLNHDILNRPKLILPLVRVCTVLIISLMFLVTGASAQEVGPAGPDQSVTEGTKVTLSANLSATDSFINWGPKDGDDPAFLGIDLPASNVDPYIFDAPAKLSKKLDLVFQLLAIDSDGNTIIDTVTITVTAGPNDPPTADAGPERIVTAGELVTLDGSGSSDPEREELTYVWSQISGADVDLSDDSAANPSFTVPTGLAPGSVLEFSLIVTDARNLSSRADTVTITVRAGSRNAAPTANAGEDLLWPEMSTVTLDGSGSSDPEREELTYAWSQTAGAGVTLNGADTPNPSFRTPVLTATEIELSFSLIVTDASGKPSGAATVTITVSATVTESPNHAPTADAGADQSVPEMSTVTLDGSGSSDPEREELTYVWSQISGADVDLSDDSAAKPTFTVPTGLAPRAVLEFSLIVTDASGKSSRADIVMVTVSATVTIQNTVDTINDFLHTRTNLILANQPKLSRRINRLQRGIGSEQLSFAKGEISKLKPFEFNFLSLGSGTYKFATSLDQVTRAADHLQVMQGDVGGLTATHERRRFDVWFEASFNKFNAAAGSSGDFAIAYLGADYLVSPDLLFGGLLQYDSLSDSSISEDSRTEGKGWMAGPYVTARLQDNLYLDARLAWGKSDNEIRPPGASYTDSFTSTRRLANISLSGEFTQGQWTIRPNASLSYMADKQRAYTNNLGATIPSQTVSSGQLRLGPNVSTQFLGDNG